MDMHRMLLRLGILEALNEEQISAMREVITTRRMVASETLFVQGERCEHLHVVQNGSLQLVTEHNGVRHILETVGMGSVLGEVGVFLAMAYPCTAVASEECLIASLGQNDLRHLSGSVPGLCWQLLRLLSLRLVGMQVRVQALSSPDVRVRVGAVLLQMAQENARTLRAGSVILRGRQVEIAQRAAVARETVSRLLTEWSQRGLLIVGRGRVTILDVTAFQVMVENLTAMGDQPSR